MRAGQLRHEIEIQQTTDTLDAAGQPTRSWTTFANVWASIEPVSGSELVVARQLDPKTTHKVTMRYLSGVTAKMRIRHGTRYLEPVEPPRNTDERNIMLEFLCKEATA